MEVDRQTEVRLATWLCEAIEDSIKRFQTAAEQSTKMAKEDWDKAEEDRKKMNDPLLSKLADPDFYENQARRWQKYANQDKEGIDQLLPLLQSAKILKEGIIKFWEGRKALYSKTESE